MIEDGKTVEIHYEVSDGTAVIESTYGGEALSFVQGRRQILPAIENHLRGLSPGNIKKFILGPEDAFGVIKSEAIVEVPKREMPPDDQLVLGMEVHDPEKSGIFKAGWVVEIKPDCVVVDFNHPMAGKELHFRIEILSVT